MAPKTLRGGPRDPRRRKLLDGAAVAPVMTRPPLLHETRSGLYCPAGDFHVDPWRPVDRAIITHAHADHARPGSKAYLCTTSGLSVLRPRLGDEASIETADRPGDGAASLVCSRDHRAQGTRYCIKKQYLVQNAVAAATQAAFEDHLFVAVGHQA